MSVALRRWIAAAAILIGAQVVHGQNKEDEPSPEVKATIKLHTTTLKNSKVAGERAKAAHALGELGASGKLARRPLCQAMLDPSKNVGTAAADALRKIDEPMYKLATAIMINADVNAVNEAAKLGPQGEPLAPLIQKLAPIKAVEAQNLAQKSMGDRDEVINPQVIAAASNYQTCIAALGAVANKDLSMSKTVTNSLNFQLPKTWFAGLAAGVRRTGIDSLRKFANVKQSMAALIASAAKDTASGNRVAAIDVLAQIADADNTPAIRKAINGMRFDADQNVRAAVERALDKLKEK